MSPSKTLATPFPAVWETVPFLGSQPFDVHCNSVRRKAQNLLLWHIASLPNSRQTEPKAFPPPFTSPSDPSASPTQPGPASPRPPGVLRLSPPGRDGKEREGEGGCPPRTEAWGGRPGRRNLPAAPRGAGRAAHRTAPLPASARPREAGGRAGGAEGRPRPRPPAASRCERPTAVAGSPGDKRGEIRSAAAQVGNASRRGFGGGGSPG